MRIPGGGGSTPAGGLMITVILIAVGLTDTQDAEGESDEPASNNELESQPTG